MHQPTRSAALHALVVTFRRPHDVGATLQSIFHQSRPPDRVLVIDNGGSEEVRSMVSSLPRSTYLAPGDNLGPAGAIELGMTRICEAAQAEDWILLVDDDDPPPFDDALDRLWEVAQSAPPDVAAVGLTGARFNSRRARLVRVTDDELDERLTYVDYLGSNQLPLYRVRAVVDIGPFDARLFFGFEELEYGLRLGSRGWKIVIPGDLTLRVRALHGRSGLGRYARSPTKQVPWRRYYSSRNMVHITRRHCSPRTSAVATARACLSAMRLALRARDPEGSRAVMAGLTDGWRGVVGRTVEPDPGPLRRVSRRSRARSGS